MCAQPFKSFARGPLVANPPNCQTRCMDLLPASLTECVAQLTGSSVHELPQPSPGGDDQRAVLGQWLARRHFGLVSVASPGNFSWPGHWIGIVASGSAAGEVVAVILFGPPSAVIASPAAPALVGKGADELTIREGLVLVPFQPLGGAKVEPRLGRGEVVQIYVAPAKTVPMKSVDVVTAIAGRGLDGDRYAAGAGTFTPRSERLRGYDLTLIEGEVLERAVLPDGSRLPAVESRRNVVTRGVDLNALVGREFRIGSVRAFGQRLCEPCAHLQRLTRPGVVAGFVHQGGLRADILTGGEIHVGDAVEAAGLRR